LEEPNVALQEIQVIQKRATPVFAAHLQEQNNIGMYRSYLQQLQYPRRSSSQERLGQSFQQLADGL
jgi:hypothetical protein